MMDDKEIQEFKKQIKQQVLAELKDDRTLAMEEAAQRRVTETEQRTIYFNKMKESPDPWVEIVGWVETDKGVKVELEWNDAFVDFLKVEGVTGADDNQIVQKWVAMLLHNMADDMEEQGKPDGTSEFT